MSARVLIGWLSRFAVGLSLFLGSAARGENLSGIGVVMGVEDSHFVIKKVLPDSPAARSKQIEVNDEIIAIAEAGRPPVPLDGKKLAQMVDLIRGAAGTQVSLTVRPKGTAATPHVVTLVRETLKLPAPPSQTETPDRLQPGKAVPEISGQDVEGGQFKLSEYRGKVVLIDFWGDW